MDCSSIEAIQKITFTSGTTGFPKGVCLTADQQLQVEGIRASASHQLSLIEEILDYASIEVGKIEMHDKFSYVAVTKSVSERALSSLSQGRIKGKRFKAELVK